MGKCAGLVVERLSSYMSRSDAKAWDGYLVLLTPGVRGSSKQEAWTRIRYDTSRVRKLVASGEDLSSLSELNDMLRPLLPVKSEAILFTEEKSILKALPRLLTQEAGIKPAEVETVIEAFKTGKNMIKALYDDRRSAE